MLQISGEDLTEAIQSAAESLRSAELNMDNMQEAMNNYTITSPIRGTIIEKAAKAGDALTAGADLCTIYDLSYLEMTINVDELQVSSLSVGQSVQVTADAVPDKTYIGEVPRVSMKGNSSCGPPTYPVTVRVDETEGLRRIYKERSDVLATIPMNLCGSASSFYVACAATVMFYEAVRQRAAATCRGEVAGGAC